MKRLLTVAALFGAALQLQAAKVVNVSVRGSRSGDVSVSDVTARCEVKTGSEYDPAACARDVKALRDTGEYEDISVEAKHVDGGIDVVYVVVPITSISFQDIIKSSSRPIMPKKRDLPYTIID